MKKLQVMLLTTMLILGSISSTTVFANQSVNNDILSSNEVTTMALRYREFGTYRGLFFVEGAAVYVFQYEYVGMFGQTFYVYSY